MMEFKRVWNIKVIITLLCLAAVSVILFYNEQIQNGTNEIIRYDESYNQNRYSIFDVNQMELDMINQYNTGKWKETQDGQTDDIKAFINWYYVTYIGKNSPKRDVFMVTKELFYNKAVYVEGYAQRIAGMYENAKAMVRIGAFSDKNSFSYKNILKTSYDLSQNAQIKTELSGMRAWESVYQYKIIGYFHIAFMMIIVFSFLSERKKGLWSIIFLSTGGRWKLAAKRLMIIAVSAVISAVVLYGTIWGESLFLYHGGQSLTVPVQSSCIFSDVLLHINKIQYIGLNILLCACAAMTVAVIVWGIISVCKSQTGYMAVLLCVFVPEYIFYTVISQRNALAVLKYFNIFQLFVPMNSVVEYANCEIGTLLFGRIELIAGLVLALFLAGAFLSIRAAQTNYPIHHFSKMKKTADIISEKYHSLIAKLTPSGLEVYKLLVIQKGFIILLILIVLMSNVKIYGGVSYDEERIILREYYEKTQGMTTGAAVNVEISSYRDRLERMQEQYAELKLAAKEEKEADGAVLDELIKDITVLSTAVEYMEHQTEYLENMKETRRVNPVIIAPYIYENMLGGRLDYSMNIVSLYVFVTLILLMNGAFAYEKKDNMTMVIRSGAKGRTFFAVRKLLIESVLTILIGAGVYGYFYYKVLCVYHLTGIDNSILCLEMMKDFPIDITIRQYLIWGVLWKILFMCTGTMVITFISLVLREQAALLVSLLILVPHVLYLLNFKFFQYFSVIIPMNPWQMWRIYPKKMIYAVYLWAFFIGGFAAYGIIKKWSINTKLR